MNLFSRPAFKILFLAVSILSPESSGQSSLQNEITSKFLKYIADNPWEEVFIHSDRVEYISGEYLWFSAYVIDRSNNKLSDASRVVYVELLNSDNAPVAQKKVKAVMGSGFGEINLPDTLTTGSYTLKAYTNYMKNFGAEYFFTRKINIYNAIAVKNKLTKIKRSQTTGDYPSGLENSGKPGATGLNHEIIRLTKDTLTLSITADQSFRSANQNSCLIFIQSRGNIVFSAMISLPGEKTGYYVPGSVLLHGINHITFFDLNGRPVSEKFLINIRQPEIVFNTDLRNSYSRREKVTMGIEMPAAAEKSLLPASFSFSAVPVTVEEDKQDLTRYLIFGSEFGELPDRIRYSDPGTLHGTDLNALLPGIKSKWINWEDILSGKEEKRGLPFERDDHILSGRLVQKDRSVPPENELLFLSSPGKNAIFQYAKTDKLGRFSFTIPVADGVQDIIIQPERFDKDYSIELISPFTETNPRGLESESSSEDTVPDYINKWGVNYQVNRIFGISNSGSVEEPPVRLQELKRFYGKPDIGLIMDDYIKLPVMEEVFFELLPGVSLKTRRSVTEISLIGSTEYMTFSKTPVLMIDGVIINDAAIIANLDPETVERIDVIKERYIVGDYIFYGLINVITRAGDFSHVTLPDYAVRLRYRIFDPVSTFASPDYSVPPSGPDKTPDFRNTLFWNPSLKPLQDGTLKAEFWTSDLPGDYEINIRGFSGDGKPVSIRKIITIR